MRNVFSVLGLPLLCCVLSAVAAAQDTIDAFKPIDETAPKTPFASTPAPTEQAATANDADIDFPASVAPKKPQLADNVSDMRRSAPPSNVDLFGSVDTAAPAIADTNPALAKQYTDIPKPQRHDRRTGMESASLTMPSALPPAVPSALPAVMNTAANDSSYLSSQPANHPLARYLGVANDGLSKIAGKPMPVAELLHGVRSASARNGLLQAYWELSGKLAEYNIQRESSAAALRIAELEFVKAQWKLAEIIKRYKNIDYNENNLPIPADYPLYQGYETYAQQIARSDRTEYLARVIPIQEQLIGTKLQMSGTADALLDMVKTIVEYNCMIAEYVSMTVSPNVDIETMVGAVIKLPKRDNPRPIRQTSYRQSGACVTGCSNANYIIR